MLKDKINQAGDTIIEVLVAMAVLGLILTGAFVTANSSLDGEHTAQEHMQALTIAQGQVEDLYAGDQLGNDNCFDTTNASNPTNGAYCFVSNTNQFCKTNIPNADPTIATCAAASSAAYWYQISDTSTQDTLPAPSSLPVTNYEVEISWPSLSGTTATVQLYYRPQ
ncbi:MAG TPA: prepilin-type N-terminal cleavage/methylation domain-containing protein [Candidatus Binatia bacterium]|nr:prepilin-type N-terminal cleavage/methylation domain-containing protein [Candidatus Binatia bacterium]